MLWGMEEGRAKQVLTRGLYTGRACDADCERPTDAALVVPHLVKLNGIVMRGLRGVSDMATVEGIDFGARAPPRALGALGCLPLYLLIVSNWSSVLFCERNSDQPTILDANNT